MQTLAIVRGKTNDDNLVGSKMDQRTTGRDLFPNCVAIGMEDRDPPTMSTEDRARLSKEFKKAEFLKLHKNGWPRNTYVFMKSG